MRTSNLNTSVLWSAFDDVRRQGVPLGLSEYLVVVETLRQGRAVENDEALKRLCRLVWAKSVDDMAVVDQSLNKFMEPWLAQRPKEADVSTPQAKRTSQDLPSVDRDRQQGIPHSPGEPTETQKTETREQGAVPGWSLGQAGVAQGSQGLPRPVQPYQSVPRWPVTQREIASTWRVLRRPRRDGPAIEWDVEETLNQVAQTGMFLWPVYRSLRRNHSRLMLLIDRGTSMGPFHPLVAHLLHSLQFAGFQGRTETWFFEGSPGPVVYAHSHLVDPQPILAVLAEQPQECGVIVVGDAGATQHVKYTERLQEYREALRGIRAKRSKLVWLNPMPHARWKGTMAEQVARQVPMFPWSKRGMRNLVDYIRGTKRAWQGVAHV